MFIKFSDTMAIGQRRQAKLGYLILLCLSLKTISCSPSEMLSQQQQSSLSSSSANQLADLSSQQLASKKQASLSMAQQQQVPASSHQSPLSASAVGQPQQMAAMQNNGQQQQPRLPNLNLYMKKQEVFKLLGINKEIPYVTNGSINHYAIGFTIPMGYNQSDMIFTWQNLSPTNVNYSISLVIGNVQAFDHPQINISRSGLIPKQEQVFKITLPCSGKVSDEVDVQVLIQVTGIVMPTDEGLPTANNGFQQQDFNQLMGGLQASANATNSSPEMQSDDPQMGRLIAHTLAIKRRKICAQHLVQVGPKPSMVHPPSWTPSSYSQASQPPPPPPSSPTSSVIDNSQQQVEGNNKRPSATDIPEKNQASLQPPINNKPNLKLDIQQSYSSPPSNQIEQNEAEARRSLEQRNFIGSRNFQAGTGSNPLAQPPTSNRIDDLPSTSPYLSWSSASTNRLYNSIIPPAPSPIPPENPLNEILMSNNNLVAGRQQVAQNQTASQSPLLLSLIGLSLFVTVALIVVALLGSSHRRPMEKLGGLTGCILGPASVTRATKKCKSPMASAVISSLRSANQKLGKQATIGLGSGAGLGSVGGHSPNLRPISVGCQQAFGLSSKAQTNYCYKQTNYSPVAGYYATNQYQQHHYQAPPSGDLLGAGYMNQQQQQQHHQGQHPPICHIATGGNNQTTRLIWSNGNGTSPDGFTIDGSYMPLSNAPHSDSGGSVYQSIY